MDWNCLVRKWLDLIENINSICNTYLRCNWVNSFLQAAIYFIMLPLASILISAVKHSMIPIDSVVYWKLEVLNVQVIALNDCKQTFRPLHFRMSPSNRCIQMLIAIVAAQDEFKQFLASKWFIELLLAIIATQLIEEAILTFSIDKVFSWNVT